VDASSLDADRIIAELGLAPHPEGGWYRQTWRDEAGTAILFLLRRGEHSAWHRVHGRAEIWHFYAGAALDLHVAGSPDVRLSSLEPQAVVAPGAWQRAESTGAWSLVGTTVAPPFDFSAFELAPAGFDPGAAVLPTSNVSGVTSVEAQEVGKGATDAAQPAPDPLDPNLETLSIDIGGTGLKASVLSETGQMERDRVRIDTPYPLAPEKLVHVLTDLVKPLGHYDRVSVGFPGMVRDGKVLSAPHFISPAGPGGVPTAKLTAAWARFDLQAALAQSLGKPAKVANDADLQGSAVVGGQGLEVVVTLGTGVGSALFYEGKLLPHLEFAHHAFRKDQTYNEALGDAVRKQLGAKKWNKRVAEMIEVVRALTFFDHLYIGGGNSARVEFKLDPDVTLVDNSAGILGGIKLWHRTA
jgi:polyphosphate glucokinase